MLNADRQQLPQQSFLEDAFAGPVGGIKPVLEDAGRDQTAFPGQLDHAFQAFTAGRQRLFANHVLSRLEALADDRLMAGMVGAD